MHLDERMHALVCVSHALVLVSADYLSGVMPLAVCIAVCV